ncbi:hypothetical protein INR76_06090 [Marixanthomonas sp. SCSIO 43207]|uniref:hypothetical protein n=1 Tax=Marixanthomonas sp. SCSIO 43207 TaxID=2779360 RepID=UPI001CA96F4A|nr:hypothetical protein [Marixanthomonas sp. SCSIO 43207]UAB82328.1 hypothetical protein INR76_06090 [Marixanthomonas sp. SCSIO 43207]
MKNFKYILFALVIIILSCESDDDNLSTEELLIQGSPWIFDRYELSYIINDSGLNLSQSEIESITNAKNAGARISFKSDFTGWGQSPTGTYSSFEWLITNNGKLDFNPGGASSEFVTFGITGDELFFEGEDQIPDPNQPLIKLFHYGKFFYK